MGCGGGGGGGAGSFSSFFYVTDVKYGCLIDEGNGPCLVSPLTTVDVDAITGKVVPGSLLPLANGVDVNALQTFGIGVNYLPCVIPRNGVLQIEFSALVNAVSIFSDIIDADGSILSDGSIQVRTEAGKGAAVSLSQPSPNVIWVNPVTSLTVGFPPSPVDFGPDGEARADATGFLRLTLPKTGGAVIQSTQGATLGSRVDKLGDVDTPIGFNPGNRVLDFISQNQLIPTGDSFNGFLPDISPPRIIRTHTYSKTLAFGAGDSSTSSSLTDAAASFSTDAKSGLGEWATGQLVLRPGLATEETHGVLRIRSLDHRTSVAVFGRNIQGKSRQGLAVLVVNRYGDRHFLTQAWLGSAGGYDLEKSREERELASRSPKREPEVISIAAR